jgi:hypothetical protein
LLDGICSLLAAQNFPGVKGVFAVNAEEREGEEGQPSTSDRPQIVVRGSGGNSFPTFTGDDGSLLNSDFDIGIRHTNAIKARGLADLVAQYFRQCWPVEITCANGNRLIVFTDAQEPSDDSQAPQDASDNWDVDSAFTVTIQHTPAG